MKDLKEKKKNQFMTEKSIYTKLKEMFRVACSQLKKREVWTERRKLAEVGEANPNPRRPPGGALSPVFRRFNTSLETRHVPAASHDYTSRLCTDVRTTYEDVSLSD